MPRFAANLSMMFCEYDFLDRFDAAAGAGFEAVEFLFPYDFDPDAITARLRKNRLTQALFNMPPGDFARGERGLAVFPERRAEWREGIETALRYVRATGAGRLHMMAGLAAPDSAVAEKSYRECLAEAADRLAAENLDLVIEPLNGRDTPGYFLNDFGRAERILGDLARPNLKLQFDVYHCQILHGDVTMRLRRLMPLVGHMQIASIPERHEPDAQCELNWPVIFREIDRLGYDGFVGCEYRPRGGTENGLAWLERDAGPSSRAQRVAVRCARDDGAITIAGSSRSSA